MASDSAVNHQLRLLVVDDSEADAELLARAVRRGGYDLVYRRVDTEEGMRAALAGEPWDAILCDYQLPRFGPLAAIAIAREDERDVPFVVVSGAVKEEEAVEALKAGAHDFVLKDRLARLVPAITRELKEADVRRERRQALQDLQQAVEARDVFLSMASHELKTPLTALNLQVTSALRVVRDFSFSSNGLAGRLTAKLQMAAKEIVRLTALIDNLLDVTRITSGRMAIARQETDLAEIVELVVERARRLGAGATVTIQIDARGPALGFWDPVLLETIVSNLVSNAIKFGAGRPIEITVSGDAVHAALTVKDHGLGIAPDDQERIFSRFERAVPTNHFGGFGVGLWVARHAAEAHAGRIRVASIPGEGSTFVVELPRRTAER